MRKSEDDVIMNRNALKYGIAHRWIGQELVESIEDIDRDGEVAILFSEYLIKLLWYLLLDEHHADFRITGHVCD